MKIQIHCGIDPGQSGSIACIPNNDPSKAWAIKMPETLGDLWAHISELSKLEHEAVAYLESVHSMPGQGVSSSFKFGRGFGTLEMALTAAGIRFEYVTPQKWQKALGCLTKGDKNVSKAKAQQLFPHLKITHAIADGLLIAEYCRRASI